MKLKRIGRVLVCLLLVCALVVNASPIKAKASVVGATAAITAASTVLTPAGLVIGATFVALGLAAAANPEGFQNMVDAGVSALESAGTWVKDGMVELLRTVDADGNASYYVYSGLMEDTRIWAYSTGAVIRKEIIGSGSSVDTSVRIPFHNGSYAVCNLPCQVVKYCGYSDTASGAVWVHYGLGMVITPEALFTERFTLYDSSGSVKGGDTSINTRTFNGETLYFLHYQESYCAESYAEAQSFASSLSGFVNLGYNLSSYSGANVVAVLGSGLTATEEITSSYGDSIVLENIPSVPVDGTSARQWSENYTDNGLKIIQGGSGNNNNDGKWFWPLALTLTAAELYAMSQADEWSGRTPQEFDDYTTQTEFEILSQPEVEFGQGIEIKPVTSPTPDSGGGSDPTEPGDDEDPGENTEPTTPPGGSPEFPGTDNPDTGGDGEAGSDTGSQTDYTSWFERLIKGIEEIPSKFADWFNNIISKLERIIEGITTLGEQIGHGLQTLGQTIIDGVRNVLSSLFSPSENYLENKVQELKAKHYNLAQFTELGENLRTFFAGLGTKPPIIYIDLGAATGSLLWGGRQIFLDLTWYAEYKPKMDFILGGIIWLWLAWRIFLAIPGIISGMPGTPGAPDVTIGTGYIPPIPGQQALPSGEKKRRYRK